MRGKTVSSFLVRWFYQMIEEMSREEKKTLQINRKNLPGKLMCKNSFGKQQTPQVSALFSGSSLTHTLSSMQTKEEEKKQQQKYLAQVWAISSISMQPVGFQSHFSHQGNPEHVAFIFLSVMLMRVKNRRELATWCSIADTNAAS